MALHTLRPSAHHDLPPLTGAPPVRAADDFLYYAALTAIAFAIVLCISAPLWGPAALFWLVAP